MDLLYEIFNYIKFENQIKFTQCNKITKFDIIDFYNIDAKYIYKINDPEILFPLLTYKNIKYFNSNIAIASAKELIKLQVFDPEGYVINVNNGIEIMDFVMFKHIDDRSEEH